MMPIEIKPVTSGKKTEVHHIWTKFYLDGKLAGEDKFNKGPTVVCPNLQYQQHRARKGELICSQMRGG